MCVYERNKGRGKKGKTVREIAEQRGRKTERR